MELLYALLSFLFFILIIVIFMQVWETDSNITSTPGTTKATTQATTQAPTNDSYWHWSNWYSMYTNIMNKITVIYVPQATLAPKTTYTTYGSTVPTTYPPTTSATTSATTYPPTTYTATPYTATTYIPATTYTTPGSIFTTSGTL